MSNEQTDYELFVSYARLDNRPIPETYPHGWVSALRDQIIVDHRLYSTAPMRVFFDQHEIRDMDDWRNRILGALRRSKVLLICLSPNYFRSGPCRWEWEEYQARQHLKLIGSDSHATVYFVDAAGNGRVTRTSTFGYYRFDSVETGQNVVVIVSSKRFQYEPLVVPFNTDLTGVDVMPSIFPGFFPRH